MEHFFVVFRAGWYNSILTEIVVLCLPGNINWAGNLHIIYPCCKQSRKIQDKSCGGCISEIYQQFLACYIWKHQNIHTRHVANKQSYSQYINNVKYCVFGNERKMREADAVGRNDTQCTILFPLFLRYNLSSHLEFRMWHIIMH